METITSWKDKVVSAANELSPSRNASDFDKASFVAETLLRELAAIREPTWPEACSWYLAFYQFAGHRRLGAIIKRVAQEYQNEHGG